MFFSCILPKEPNPVDPYGTMIIPKPALDLTSRIIDYTVNALLATSSLIATTFLSPEVVAYESYLFWRLYPFCDPRNPFIGHLY